MYALYFRYGSSRSGYMSDTGTNKSSLGSSYGRASSLSRGSMYGSSASINRESSVEPRSSRPSRADYEGGGGGGGGRFSRSDWSRKPVTFGSSYTPKSGGYTPSTPSTSSVSPKPHSFTPSYPKPTGTSYTAPTRPKTTDYVLTPFTTRRSTKTSDVNLTPFATRSSRQNAVTGQPPEKAVTTEKSKKTVKEPVRKKSTDSSDSVEEPEDDRDRIPNVRYLTSRATSPLDSLRIERYRDRQKKKISRTKTKTYPMKVYKRKRDQPKVKDMGCQADENDIDNIGKKKKTNRYEEFKETQSMLEATKKDNRITRKPPRSPEQNTVSISKAMVGNRREKFEKVSSPKQAPKQSSFRAKQRPAGKEIEYKKQEPMDSSAAEGDDEVEDDDSSVKQSGFKSNKWKKKAVKPQKEQNVAALTPENLSLKESIEKVKKWKRQLQDSPPEDWDFGDDSDAQDHHKDKLQRQRSEMVSGKTAMLTGYERQKSTPGNYIHRQEDDSSDGFSRDQSPNYSKPPLSPGKNRKRVSRNHASFDDVSTSEDETWFTRDISPNRELSKSKQTLSVDQNTDRSASPYDNVEQYNRNNNQRSISPYDNVPHRKRIPPDSNAMLYPGESMDSVATAGDLSPDPSNYLGPGRTQSLLTLDSEQGAWKYKVPKAISMGSMSTSIQSLPDLIPDYNRSQVYIGGVQDIDSILGFTETEDDFSGDDDGDSDNFFDAESDMSDTSNGNSCISTDDNLLTLPRSHNRHRNSANIEEIVFTSDVRDIDDIFENRDDENTFQYGLPEPLPIPNAIASPETAKSPSSKSLQVPKSPNTAATGSSESLLDTPVPDTPDMPLAPVPLFEFPSPTSPNSRNVQSMENLSTPLLPTVILRKPSPKLRRSTKAKSMCNLDDLDSLLETISITNKPKTHRRRKDDAEAFDLLNKEFKEELIEEAEDVIQEEEEDEEFCDASPGSNPALNELIPTEGQDSVDNVPVAKLIEFGCGILGSGLDMNAIDGLYPKNYSAEAISEVLWVEQCKGTVETAELLNVCKLHLPKKPEWLLQQEDAKFTGYKNMKELLHNLGVDVKKVGL